MTAYYKKILYSGNNVVGAERTENDWFSEHKRDVNVLDK